MLQKYVRDAQVFYFILNVYIPLIIIKNFAQKIFMNHISINEIREWDRFYRGNFINCLSGFKSVNLIGTINKDGQPNLAIFSNIIHLGADPALIGFINRPLAASPHTMSNIEATQQYTINHISPLFIAQAHQTSAKYDAGVSEFEAGGLTAVYKNDCKAPFVAESKVQMALELVEIIPIKHNGTFLIIGALKDVFVDKAIIMEDGFLDINKSGSIVSLGLDSYHTCNDGERYEYAKVGTVPTKKIV